MCWLLSDPLTPVPLPQGGEGNETRIKSPLSPLGERDRGEGVGIRELNGYYLTTPLIGFCMLLIIGVLIAIGLAAFVATPLLSAEGAGSSTLPVDVTPLADLKRRRLVVYENLKDLEFEYQAGKIATQDFQSMRQNYIGEAAALMVASQDAEPLRENDAVIEQEIAARRASRKGQPPQDYNCPHCGFQNPVPVKFCGECGTRITDHPRNP